MQNDVIKTRTQNLLLSKTAIN